MILSPANLSQTPPSSSTHFLSPPTFNKPPNSIFFPSKQTPLQILSPPLQCHSPHSSLSSDIDMVQTRDGVFAPNQTKVVVLWDLDNKPPRGPPYDAAVSLRTLAARFGEVVDISAYANRHAFSHLPARVIEERRARRQMDFLERKGMITPSQPYVCSVCGRKCKTNLDLKKHFRQLHERERQKKLSRMKQLKGKKRQKFKERYLEKNSKFEEAARTLITPKVGYGLAKELRRAGVFVKTVEDKPQAADWALKRQMMHSMSRGVDWLFLVSDDSDFRDMLRKAGEANLGTVVVGDRNGVLGMQADLWVPWGGVEKGEVSEKDLVPRRKEVGDWGDGLFSISEFDEGVEGGSDLDQIVDELGIPGGKLSAGSGRFSAFSEGEEDEEEWMYDDDYDTDDDDEDDYNF
ncbi:uncharacterized protein LOC110693682 [Chenopodium quinoa]|uniref:uncharacterized protein LOC110693682 n=1 Tax=Chenopodium quinoa TaxID=63459 RepID=UPI000B790685|nr:uncharacterized protein LOC110693682 [Chenopodium quinoa]XP_021726534.1 uncharacterized protein LOC110693682 [Chenopodium quinoa]XP_021726535.1 uncharacterized protein LOC110693682 [Chenopodium quinoa]